MKRYLISSPSFRGPVELFFDGSAESRILKIDMTGAQLSHALTISFLKKVPVLEAAIAEAFSGTNVTIIQAEYEVSFNDFWVKYDRKINRKRCEPLWEKLGKTKQVQAFFGIDIYNKFLKKEAWRTKYDPETYLKNQTWENEYN